MANILAIDPGTKAGYAIFKSGRRVASGVLYLDKKSKKRPEKYLLFRDTILSLIKRHKIDILAFEDVPPRVHRSKHACRMYNGLIALLEIAAHENGIELVGVHIATAKKALTGDGRASKQDMVKSAKSKWKKADIETDDVADALAIGYSVVKSR